MTLARIAFTFAVGAAGVAAFRLAGLPLPFLLGPIFGCLLAALAGLRLASWTPLTDAMRSILGVAIGASFTPALLGQLPSMAASLVLSALFLVASGIAGYPFLRRMCGFDAPTAFYASMPGGLQDMLLFGQDAGGDPRTLSLLHATRVLLIVTVVPTILTASFAVDLAGAPAASARSFAPADLAVMAAAAILGWRGGVAVGLFGATMLGPMFVTAALSLSGIIEQRPPSEAIQAAQFFIGITVGVKYSGITLGEVRRVLVAGFGYGLILAALAAIFAAAAILLNVARPIDAILAFSPGGQAEMAIMAIAAGADVAYVIAHHVLRVILVITCAPLVFRWLR